MATREETLKDMLRALEPQPNNDDRTKLLAALKAFSVKQLSRMQQAGVRFWTIGEIPNVPLSIPAGKLKYIAEVRVVHLTNKIEVCETRHELAHAWDHVRMLPPKRLRRLDGLDPKQIQAELDAKIQMYSGQSPLFKKWVKSYKERLVTDDDAFDVCAVGGYSYTSPQDFYAEGYAVFQSFASHKQARLLFYAPELFDFLEKEAKHEGLPLPDRGVLHKQIKGEKLTWKKK